MDLKEDTPKQFEYTPLQLENLAIMMEEMAAMPKDEMPYKRPPGERGMYEIQRRETFERNTRKIQESENELESMHPVQ